MGSTAGTILGFYKISRLGMVEVKQVKNRFYYFSRLAGRWMPIKRQEVIEADLIND